jgi:hypothetical protein
MIDNYVFNSARMGESVSAFSVTSDSDTQSNYDTKRVMRINAPHWLPPKEVADLYCVNEWNLSVKFTTPDFFIPGLEGTDEYTFKAGKATTVVDYDGEITTLTSDGPGWDSVVDGISGKRYFSEDDESYIDGQIGTLNLEKYVTVTIEDEITEEEFDYVLILRVSCEVIGPRPMLYVEGGKSREVWELNIMLTGNARSRFINDPEPTAPQIETRVGTYLSKDNAPHLIGTVNESEPINDESIEITLSAASYHESFYPI